MWQNHPLPQETKTYETAQEEDVKRVLQLGKIFGKMLKVATGPRGLPQIRGNSDEFDLDTILVPSKHKAGYARTALFKDGLWLRATTGDDDDLTHSLHTLMIRKHDIDNERPDTYQITRLNMGGDSDPVDRYMEGVDQIATRVDDMYEFGKIVHSFELEAASRWPRALSLGELTFARIALDKS